MTRATLYISFCGRELPNSWLLKSGDADLNGITTHVLDAALGRPAAGVPVLLEQLRPADGETSPAAQVLASGVTDSDGRSGALGPDRPSVGTYRLTFDTAAYFAATGQIGFYPTVTVTFALTDPTRHHHVPVLLSPYAFTTYQGS